jgi:hypothetical protein
MDYQFDAAQKTRDKDSDWLQASDPFRSDEPERDVGIMKQIREAAKKGYAGEFLFMFPMDPSKGTECTLWHFKVEDGRLTDNTRLGPMMLKEKKAKLAEIWSEMVGQADFRKAARNKGFI